MAEYHVQTNAFCGMMIPHGEYETYGEAQTRLKERCDYVKTLGCNLDYISPNEVEVGEPDNCGFIPDYCGILRIKKVETDQECNGCCNRIPLSRHHRYCEDCQ